MPVVTVAIRFDVLGVKFAVVERYTRYSVTPTLSVDWFHATRCELALRRVTDSPFGVVGATVSDVCWTLTVWATDGTPLSSSRKTMYMPGGATFGLVGDWS